MSDVQIFIGSVSLVSGILLARFRGRLGSGLCEKARLDQRGLFRLAPDFLRESLCDVREACRIVLCLGVFLAVQGMFFLCIPIT